MQKYEVLCLANQLVVHKELVDCFAHQVALGAAGCSFELFHGCVLVLGDPGTDGR